MDLLELIRRPAVPAPWSEGEKIPWQEPGFSRRMLREHVSQEHDAASRRFETIDRHVGWIHDGLLAGQPSRILDLGCGPGLYTGRLAKRGHQCVGIDFSPAAIAHARQCARTEGLRCAYVEDDMRAADYGRGYGLVMLLYGELNTFRPAEARSILGKARDALADDGFLLLEVPSFASVRTRGCRPRSWRTVQSGLFGDRPYVCLEEACWDEDHAVATERYYIIDGSTCEITRHVASTQAYEDAQYRSLLEGCGLGETVVHPSFGDAEERPPDDYAVLVSRKRRSA